MSAVNTYISDYEEPISAILKKIRNIILSCDADISESISYGMPAYKLHGKPLVYFGAQKKHIGFYATPSGHKKFEGRLSEYKRGKGSVQFPYSKPIPYDLIEDMVKFRIEETRAALK